MHEQLRQTVFLAQSSEEVFSPKGSLIVAVKYLHTHTCLALMKALGPSITPQTPVFPRPYRYSESTKILRYEARAANKDFMGGKMKSRN